MSNKDTSSMTLTRDELNEVDEKILEVLADGRATPTLVRKMLDEAGTDVSRQYINQRMQRLSEHDHMENLLDTGVYELVKDPRDLS